MGDTDRRARVAQICGTDNGARWMVQIAAGLEARGYDVVAIIGGAAGDTARSLQEEGIPYEVLPHSVLSSRPLAGRISRLPAPLRYLRLVVDAYDFASSCLRMARLLRRLRVDIVHSHVFHSILVARFAGALARVPVRLAMVPGPWHLDTALLRTIDLATCALDHNVIGGSRHIAERYERAGVSPLRRSCVPYGVDPAEFDPARADGARLRTELGITPATPLIGQVAHFYPVASGPFAPPGLRGTALKGHTEHLHAARIVLERMPDARFVFVGGGWGEKGEAHREDIRRLSVELGVDHAVQLLGWRHDIPDVLAALDVSVQCSLTENYGGTIESLMMERPTIATCVGGMPEVVLHERTGLLVEPRDPAGLAAAMLRLLEDRDLAARLARAGREHVLARFTTEACVRGVDAVYRSVGARRGLARLPLAA